MKCVMSEESYHACTGDPRTQSIDIIKSRKRKEINICTSARKQE